MASAADRAAQNFTMPALSPTMTEGNIASWRIKEGETFTAGDVLLEIETDKATMDVEAQDDGIMFKIIQGSETKGVKVGERIAITAEEGDDINTLEMPAEKNAPAKAEAPKPQEQEQKKPEPSHSKADFGAVQKTQGGKAQKQKYPLYPAVQHLLKASGLSVQDADKIPASGPKGRLLKGDVLAYIGKITQSYPAEITTRLAKLSHLDLSNIQLAVVAPPPKAEKATPAAAAPVELPKETEVALPISLIAVIATQQRVQEALGITLPLSTFVARATELANESLPASKNQKPTAEDLFNSVLGLDAVPRSSRGSFLPNITALGPAPFAAPSRSASKPDIIDLLSSKSVKPARKAAKPTSATAGPSVFSVSAQNGEEKRAMEFLERMKLVLEQEPGRLVL
jgi:pyruvate/2-oxoglutarate dehydrogenase complex dihydrolipoamide acyltransferase (E2) component